MREQKSKAEWGGQTFQIALNPAYRYSAFRVETFGKGINPEMVGTFDNWQGALAAIQPYHKHGYMTFTSRKRVKAYLDLYALHNSAIMVACYAGLIRGGCKEPLLTKPVTQKCQHDWAFVRQDQDGFNWYCCQLCGIPNK